MTTSATMAVKVLSKGEQTRERLLDVAQDSVLRIGFAATQIDEIITAAGVTKSGFFYHFRDKNDLAKALLLRFLDQDRALMDDLFARAYELNEDPLHGALVGLKLMADLMADLPTGHPGCLVAAYCYQEQQFSREVQEISAAAALAWRQRFRAQFDLIAARYPPRYPVDLDALADMATVLVEGGIILDKLYGGARVLPEQVLQFRNLIRTAFHP